MTSSLAWAIPVPQPSSTASVTVCGPTAKRLVATAPVASALVWPSAYQENCSGSLSASDDCEPSSTTVASEPFGERMNRLVSLSEIANNGATLAAASGA